MTGWDYLWGAIALIVISAVSEEEMNRFHMLDKLKARGVI